MKWRWCDGTGDAGGSGKVVLLLVSAVSRDAVMQLEVGMVIVVELWKLRTAGCDAGESYRGA